MLKNRSSAFTLVELLITITVVSVLVAAVVGGTSRAVDGARHAHCVGNLRALAAGAVNFANDRNGKFWSRDEVGYSRYPVRRRSVGRADVVEGISPQ